MSEPQPPSTRESLPAPTPPTSGPEPSPTDGRQSPPSAAGTVAQHPDGIGSGPGLVATGPEIEVRCGPLLNYRGMSGSDSPNPFWRGSVLLVTSAAQVTPELSLRCLGPAFSAGQSLELNLDGPAPPAPSARLSQPVRLYEDPAKTFWRFEIDVELRDHEARWEYSIANLRHLVGDNSKGQNVKSFVVPSKHQSMRIMFHSCNGFSVGTDEEAWSGPALWNDVLRVHVMKPFHVMIGGGDQVYSDAIRVSGPLSKWTAIKSPNKRRHHPFNQELRAECDDFYFENYARWYTREPFASANGIIPQINIWDDHDIIDGFGSYTDNFMRCAVFRGIGGVAFKYYMLFQHHTAPPVSTYTTDSPQTTSSQGLSGAGVDPVQLEKTYVHIEKKVDASWIMGLRPGPYVEERSRSLYLQLGKRIAFVGIDARTERTRHQVNYEDTYVEIFDRLETELNRVSDDIKHLIVLLGIPIAYPRLSWLETIFKSPIIAPVRFLNKRFGVAEGLFNKFDGKPDLLDDLDDHYTARQHKKERQALIHRLQHLASERSIRVTILGGDVHLAALGRFYSLPSLGIPTELDHRYMANIISSAITNKPPPMAVANFLARRNKIHHLDDFTDETLFNLFDKNPSNPIKTASSNHCTMPSRNYAIITETGAGLAPDGSLVAANGGVDGLAYSVPAPSGPSEATGRDGHTPLNLGEADAGSEHGAASGVEFTEKKYGMHTLDVAFRVEIANSDRDGHTTGYGLSIPALTIPPVVSSDEE
ncbi:MAG: hypothetical protein M1829_005784 [Trizodia sp. TS-e1964]|nr:MAG: hypothetical protein M1829_005784 [Trizodia sp. TS-e1964]